MCVLGALECYVIVGRVLAVTDADLAYFFSTLRECLQSCSSCGLPTSKSASKTDEEEHEDRDVVMTHNPMLVREGEAGLVKNEVVIPIEQVYSGGGSEEGEEEATYTPNLEGCPTRTS